MIIFDKERNLFHLFNKEISYIFRISQKNILQHIYFGKKIKDIDLDSYLYLGEEWSMTYFSSLNHKEEKYDDLYYYDKSMYEVPTFGLNDTRCAPFIIKDINNNKVDFRYLNHKIIKGKFKLNGLPSFKINENEGETLIILLKDVIKDIYLELSYTILNEYGVILRNSKIINKENHDIHLLKASSLVLDLPRSDFKLIHFPGDWANERKLKEDIISEGSKIISSKYGRSSHEHNPFIFLSDLEANEDIGEIYGFSFVYSGNFKFEINVNKYKTTRIICAINDEDFDYLISNNEEFILPEGILVYSNNGFNNISQILHNIIRNHLIRIPNLETKEAILLNSWEGTFFDFDTNKIIEYIHEAKKNGARMFVLDDGWFDKRNNDDSSLGDWFINKDKIDLKKIIDEAHNLGLKFGLWIEPEMVNPNSEFFKLHPDYVIGNKDYDIALSRHQLCLDLTNKVALEAVFNQITKILDNYDIDYIKWDHNRNILDNYSYHLAKDRQGEFFHRLTLGLYYLCEKFISRYPNILFEGCAGGGARFDLGILYYFPQIWTSDETDPIQRLFIQYSSSYMYPLITMGSHISNNPITSYKTKGEVALFGTYGFEFDPRNLSLKDKEEINEINKIFYKFHLDTISKGDLYRLANPYKSNYFSIMSINKTKSKALVLFINILKENSFYRFLKLKGLDISKKYINNYDNKIHTGEYLMNIGINLTRWLNEFTSILIEIEEVK